MTDLVQIILMGIACSAIGESCFQWGKRCRQPIRPIDLIDICPTPYVAFAPETRTEDRIEFLENLTRSLRESRSVDGAGLEDQASDKA